MTPRTFDRQISFLSADGARLVAHVKWTDSDTPATLGARVVRSLRKNGHASVASHFEWRPNVLGEKLMAGQPPAAPALPPAYSGRRVRTVTEWTVDGFPKTVEEYDA